MTVESINKVRNVLRFILKPFGINIPYYDDTLSMDYMLGLDYSEEISKPSLSNFQVGDLVENKLSGKHGIVYEVGMYNEYVFQIKVRWPNDLNVVYCDNGFDGYLLKKI
jgi:hypothetical protein